MTQTVYEALTTYGNPRRAAPFLFTCEHASNRLPPPLRVSARDRELLSTHWGWDIGAENLTRELVRRSGGYGVFARFSRLVCDPNRPVSAPTWIRREADGDAVGFNAHVTDAERERRRKLYYAPYHRAVDRAVVDRLRRGGAPPLLVSVHSFTPAYRGRPRDLEIGVLYHHHPQHARRLRRRLNAAGFSARLNQPYSGHRGMIFSVMKHGMAHGLVYLELEVRQDLIDRAAAARRMGRGLMEALEGLA